MKTCLAFLLCALSAPAQMKYADSKSGVSFEYPLGYLLKEGYLDDQDPGLGYMGPIPMEFTAPGGGRVATVETPTDSWPGTDFVNAFFTVSLNSFLTRSECDRFLDNRPRKLLPGEKIPIEPVKKIGGVNFQGFRIGFVGLGHQFSGVYYHGFLQGSCYELGYGLATAGFGAVDGMKHVDDKKVFSILEETLETVAIRPVAPGAPANSPSIHAFAVTPLDTPSNIYRVSWDVEGAQAEQIWLSTNCFGDLTILKLTDVGTKRSVVPCDVLYPVESVKGSFDLQFKNMAGQELREPIRLFVAGGKAVSKTVTISLAPL